MLAPKRRYIARILGALFAEFLRGMAGGMLAR
jgi:hypothetical protein